MVLLPTRLGELVKSGHPFCDGGATSMVLRYEDNDELCH